MIRNPRRPRILLCALALSLQPSVMTRAQEAPSPLAILGAADGQMKLLAETATVSTEVTIESTAASEMVGTFRVSPLRDAAGHLFAVTVAAPTPAPAVPAVPRPTTSMRATGQPVAPPAGGGATSATPASAQMPMVIPAMGAWSARLSAELPAEGDYSGDLIIGVAPKPVHVKLTVTRGARNLDVEVLGVTPARAGADTFGSSAASVNLVLAEKSGRALTLDAPTLIKFDRKASDGTEVQSACGLAIGGQPPASVRLTPQGTAPLTFTCTTLEGAGEYTGTLRFSAPGSKPVDQALVFSLRESRATALFAIVIGVALSMVLKWLGQNARPRLVQTRRAQLLIHEIDELLADRQLVTVEQSVLRALRRAVGEVLLRLDGGTLEGASEKLDGLEKRRSLASVWLVRRREVAALEPPTLRSPFLTILGRAELLIVDVGEAVTAVAQMETQLRELPAKMNEALRAELASRVSALRENLKALVARPNAPLSVTAPGQIGPLLDAAERAANADDLHGALAAYERARRTWVSLLLDDLDTIASGARPFALDGAEWDSLKRSLAAQVAEARRVLGDDPDAAIARYERGLALYVAKVSVAVDREIAAKRAAPAAPDTTEAERAEMLAALTAADTANAAARAAAVAGRIQEAVALLETAIAKTRAAQAVKAQKNEGAQSFVAAPMFVAPAMPLALRAVASDPLTVTEQDLHVTTSRIRRIDFGIAAVAVVIAGVLGLRALWLPNLTWGGWDDYVIAALWGLGLHQFTFAGITGLTDRLIGNSPAGS